MTSTDGAAIMIAGGTRIGGCRPAVLLPCRTLVAQPKYMLAAPQLCVVGIVATGFIALVVPLCQEGVLTLSKGWMLGDCPSRGTLWAAGFPTDTIAE